MVREYLVPSQAGMHRVNWDLRHPVSINPGMEPWTPSGQDGLPRNVEDRGHFVSPGTYTVTLVARGTTTSTTLEVRGDPEMPLTQLNTRSARPSSPGFRPSRPSLEKCWGPPRPSAEAVANKGTGISEAQRTLAEHRRNVESVYEALNGGGVRQGSLYPPTAAQRERVEGARAALRELPKGVAGRPSGSSGRLTPGPVHRPGVGPRPPDGGRTRADIHEGRESEGSPAFVPRSVSPRIRRHPQG